MRGDVKTQITATLAEKGGEFDWTSLESQLRKEYPKTIVEHVLAWLCQHGEVGVQHGKYILRMQRRVSDSNRRE